MGYYGHWKPYVSVAARRAQAKKKMAELRKKGGLIQPVEIEGRKIATTFWGQAWCDHLESFSDYDNRLPRGRTYVRNGSVCHLGMKKGKIEAKVSGSELYNIKVSIKTLSPQKWKAIKRKSSGQIGSLLDLLRGDLSDNIMQVVTDHEEGLFPNPAEISFGCDCPDWADMCKHIAAVLYGVGARLDQDPALLFALRGVDHKELIDVATQVSSPRGTGRGGAKRLASADLGDVFGIDLESAAPTASKSSAAKTNGKSRSAAKKKAAKKKTAKKKFVVKKTVKKKTVVKKRTVSTVKRKAAKRSPRKNVAMNDAAPTKKSGRPTSKKKTAKRPRAAVAKNTAGRSSKKKTSRKS